MEGLAYSLFMENTTLQYVGTLIFALALVHTFSVGIFQKMAKKAPEGSFQENIFHFFGEVEVVFGIWAAVFFWVYAFLEGYADHDAQGKVIGGAIHYIDSLNFTEPLFVFVIMSMAATRPVVIYAEKMIFWASSLIPLPKKIAFFMATLIVGPLLGSIITEPAAMTLTALILLDYFYSGAMSDKFKYATLGLLFVNVSIGGTLTHFAAPPVLMVASAWNWDTSFMMSHFGFKAITGVLLSTLAYTFIFRKDLKGALTIKEKHTNRMEPVWWMAFVHAAFIFFTVLNSHHPAVIISGFLFFVGFVNITSEYQDELRIKEALMVAFFLGGLVVLGRMQAWWLQDLLAGMNDLTLFFGATGLTALTDNAALTYLGSLVPLEEAAKYALVAGAVTGGGLTVIANAPNPAGYGILKSRFKEGIINPFYLFLAALLPTLIAAICFLFIPSF